MGRVLSATATVALNGQPHPTTPRRKSPTQRTLELLRRKGFTCGKVEQRVSPPGMTPFLRDLFGFIDIVVLDDLPGCLGVQACMVSDRYRRHAKILAEPKARRWLERGNRIAVYAWSMKGARGTRKRWTAAVTNVTVEELRPCA